MSYCICSICHVKSEQFYLLLCRLSMSVMETTLCIPGFYWLLYFLFTLFVLAPRDLSQIQRLWRLLGMQESVRLKLQMTQGKQLREQMLFIQMFGPAWARRKKLNIGNKSSEDSWFVHLFILILLLISFHVSQIDWKIGAYHKSLVLLVGIR
jgi:hypothetical protein